MAKRESLFSYISKAAEVNEESHNAIKATSGLVEMEATYTLSMNLEKSEQKKVIKIARVPASHAVIERQASQALSEHTVLNMPITKAQFDRIKRQASELASMPTQQAANPNNSELVSKNSMDRPVLAQSHNGVDSENIDQEFDMCQTEAKDIDDTLSEKGEALAQALVNHDTANDNNLPLRNTKTVKNK